MSLVAIPGVGVWMPTLPGYFTAAPTIAAGDAFLLDADEEEAQLVGYVTIDGGGTKTFGTSSKIGWRPSTSSGFVAGVTIRVGVKQAAAVSATTGPPARATIGAAAFSVWDDVVGGTDTFTQLVWREETMSAGTPFSVSDGDLMAVCFHLNITGGTPVIRGVGGGAGMSNVTSTTLVTAGPTYTAQFFNPNVVLTFDDGTLGWFEHSRATSANDTVTSAIGSGNSLANIVQVPFPCQIDALGAMVTLGAGGIGDCALELVATPLGTPTVIETILVDANITHSASNRLVFKRLLTPRTLTVNTPYAISVRQTTANAVLGTYFDVATASYLKLAGLDATCYAANSTAGATFVQQNSGLRRYLIWMRVSALDDGAGGAELLGAPPPRTRAWRQWRRARIG